MPKYIKTDKLQDNLFIPLKLSEQIIEGTLEYAMHIKDILVKKVIVLYAPTD